MEEENIIDVLCKRIKCDEDKLIKKELTVVEVDSFDLTDFWTQFGSAVQALSNEVTKVGFMCGKKPFPNDSEVKGMMKGLTQYYSVMWDNFTSLSTDVGELLYKAVSDAVINIMQALLSVVGSLKDLTEKGARERLTQTGTFWDACSAVDKLPKDNLQACIETTEAERALVTDAREELARLIEDEGVDTTGMSDNCEPWTDDERELGIKAASIVHAVQLCLDKLHRALRDFGSCTTPLDKEQLDDTAHKVQRIIPSLDDFVFELYHPIDFTSIADHAHILVEIVQNLLSSVKDYHFKEGLTMNMVTVLLQLLNSSHNALKKVATDPLPEISNLTL